MSTISPFELSMQNRGALLNEAAWTPEEQGALVHGIVCDKLYTLRTAHSLAEHIEIRELLASPRFHEYCKLAVCYEAGFQVSISSADDIVESFVEQAEIWADFAIDKGLVIPPGRIGHVRKKCRDKAAGQGCLFDGYSEGGNDA